MPAVGRGANKPKSLVEHLSEQAPKRAVSDINLNRYFFTAQLLLKQASEYRKISNEEQLYVVLLRFASLVIDTIPKHRDFRDSIAIYTTLKQDLVNNQLPELEKLKVSLCLKDRAEPPAAASRNRPLDAVQLSASALPQLDWTASGALPPPPALPPLLQSRLQLVPPPPDSNIALQVNDLLEVMGSARIPAAAQAPATAFGNSYAPTDPYALAAEAAASLSSSPLDPLQPKYGNSYSASSLSSGRHALYGGISQGSGSGRGSAAAARADAQGAGTGGLPLYPVLDVGPVAGLRPGLAAGVEDPQQQVQLASATRWMEGEWAGVLPQPSAGPSLGLQEVQVGLLPASVHGLPSTCHTPHAAQPLPPQPSPPNLITPTSTGPAGPGSGGPKEIRKLAQLRDVHVSVALMEEFLAYARSNTARGVESCGILAGRLLAGDSSFAITTLIIPKQEGTTDTVQALNEEDIFEAQFQRELYPLGWIHTHPTQTCFLSSVDVHTQCGYQTMLDEAVAIVMAPCDPSKRCGLFRLSSPGGLSLVQKCPQRGFHMHPPTDTDQELYELCGHVYLNPRTKHEVLDLR